MELYQKGKWWGFENEGKECLFPSKDRAEEYAERLGLKLDVKVSGVPYSVPTEDVNIESQS